MFTSFPPNMLTTLVVFVIKQGKPGASEDERGSTSVALDREGYLYVGCENGQIHVVNYKYLLNTNRLTRLKFQKLSSKGSSLNFPGNFCQKTFDEILKNYDAEN